MLTCIPWGVSLLEFFLSFFLSHSFYFSSLQHSPCTLRQYTHLIHSIIHSFIQSFIHSVIHSFSHSFIHSFTHSFITIGLLVPHYTLPTSAPVGHSNVLPSSNVLFLSSLHLLRAQSIAPCVLVRLVPNRCRALQAW